MLVYMHMPMCEFFHSITCTYLIPFYSYSGAVEKVLARPLFLGEALLSVKSLSQFNRQGKFFIVWVLVALKILNTCYRMLFI